MSRRDSALLIHTAIDHGVRVIDTADTYGSGDSERTIGAALSGRPREDYMLITKAGLPHVALPAALSPLNQVGKKLLQYTSRAKNFSKPYLKACVQLSLKRLGTRYVDAFLLHAAEAGEPGADSWEALKEIREQGFSRMTGVSTSDPEVVRQGIASGQVSIVEAPISCVAPNAEEIGRLCAANGVALVANECLKPRALLQQRAAAWDQMRSRYGVSEVSTILLLIAYASAQPGVSSVIIGTQSPKHVVENLQALQYRDNLKSLFEEMKETFQ
jgi:aryl-alcohol dehydrogenase-like predicted oxidoreductase